eukprot:SAG31_NODE_3075_length_4712_cov_2.262302_3_plen_761_part_00
MQGRDEKLLRDLFNDMDADGSGSVDASEVAALAEQLGSPLDEAELAAAMQEMDADGSGEVDFDEFCGWWARQQESKGKFAAALEAARAQRIRMAELDVGKMEAELQLQQHANGIKAQLEGQSTLYRQSGWILPLPEEEGSLIEALSDEKTSAWPHRGDQPHEFLGRRTCRPYPTPESGPRLGTVVGWLPENPDARVAESFRLQYDQVAKIEELDAEQIFQAINAAERIAAEVAADLRSAVQATTFDTVGDGAAVPEPAVAHENIIVGPNGTAGCSTGNRCTDPDELALQRLRLAAPLLRAAKGKLMGMPEAVACKEKARELGNALRERENACVRDAGNFAATLGKYAAMFELACGRQLSTEVAAVVGRRRGAKLPQLRIRALSMLRERVLRAGGSAPPERRRYRGQLETVEQQMWSSQTLDLLLQDMAAAGYRHGSRVSQPRLVETNLRDLFNDMDADGSGSVDASEVAALAEQLGSPLDEAELAAAMQEMDADGSGEVDFDEFCGWWARQPQNERQQQDSALEGGALRWTTALAGAKHLVEFGPFCGWIMKQQHRLEQQRPGTVNVEGQKAQPPAAGPKGAEHEAVSLLGLQIAKWLQEEVKLHWRSWLPTTLLSSSFQGSSGMQAAADPNCEPPPVALDVLLDAVAKTFGSAESRNGDGPLETLSHGVLQGGPFAVAPAAPGLGQTMVRSLYRDAIRYDDGIDKMHAGLNRKDFARLCDRLGAQTTMVHAVVSGILYLTPITPCTSIPLLNVYSYDGM